MHVAFNNNDKMSAIGKLKLKQIASHSKTSNKRRVSTIASNEPDPATKHPQQNPRQTNLSIRTRTSSARISTRT